MMNVNCFNEVGLESINCVKMGEQTSCEWRFIMIPKPYF